MKWKLVLEIEIDESGKRSPPVLKSAWCPSPENDNSKADRDRS
jgi:hypothetical protein